MSQENVEIARRAIAALNDRDVEGYIGLCTVDVEFVSPLDEIEGSKPGEGGIRQFFSRLDEAAGSFRVEVEEFTAVGDERLVALTRVSATTDGGLHLDYPAAVVYDFAGAKIQRVEVFRDRPEALKAAGLSE